MSAALKRDYRPFPEREAAEMPQLRFLTCGSVDDGKSTLLGRLLFDSNAVLEDQLSALDRDSLKWGTAGRDRDFALLVDGLSAEREQGITIDVAYRYFSTSRRSFIVADTPGHEQYTRNMATGASTADLAILLIDARKGILPQTRRHAFIVATLGVRHVVLAVNKMDLVDFSETVWRDIVQEFRASTASLGFISIVPIPICARDGSNVAARSDKMPWYNGPVLLDHLETVSIAPPAAGSGAFRFPVQLVIRPDLDFRGYAGTVTGGTMRTGQAVTVCPNGQTTRIARIVVHGGDRTSVEAGAAVSITLADEIDVSRGDVIAPADDAPAVSRQAAVRLIWMIETPLREGQTFLARSGTATANARVARIRHAIDIQTYQPAAPAIDNALGMNEIGLVELIFDKPLALAPYAENRTLGALILVDRATNQTAAMAVIEEIAISAKLTTTADFPAPAHAVANPRANSIAGAVAIGLLGTALTRHALAGVALGCVDILVHTALARWPVGRWLGVVTRAEIR